MRVAGGYDVLWVKILLGYCLFVALFCWFMQRVGRYLRGGGSGRGPIDPQLPEAHNPDSRHR